MLASMMLANIFEGNPIKAGHAADVSDKGDQTQAPAFAAGKEG